MNRSLVTMWLAGVLAVVLLALAGVTTVPYVMLSPGPTTDTLGLTPKREPVIRISGARTYPEKGRLDLTVVQVYDKLTLFEALRGWVSDRDAVIPREFVYPEGRSEQENQAETAQQMTESQEDATTAALSQLGLSRVAVEEVTKGGPSAGKLRPGDVILEVDGAAVSGPGPLRAQIRKRKVGEDVRLTVQRAGAGRRPVTVTVTTGPAPDRPAAPAVGITTRITSPVKVDIKLRDIGGPSAGLMFALGIIEKLGPQSLTGGKHVAGSGSIEADGAVGPIGGIAAKLIGAKEAGAEVFLVPAGNCREAKANAPEGLPLIKVATLKDALSGLAAVRAGRTAPGC